MSTELKENCKAMDSVLGRVDELHSLPQVAISILNLTRDVDYDVREVVACLENDPALAAKILRTINSSRYGLRREVTNLRQAVALLGQRALRLVAMTFSLVDGLSRGAAGQLCQDYWRRSISMATLGSRIAKRSGQIDHNDAYSAGLLADLGVLVFAQVKQDEYVQLAQSVPHGVGLIQLEREQYGFSHAELGARLLSRWGFPETLVESARLHHDEEVDESLLPLTTHTGSLMAEVLWTPECEEFARARTLLEERFCFGVDDIIDLVVGTKEDVEFNAGLFGVALEGEIDLEAIRSRAKTAREEAFAILAADTTDETSDLQQPESDPEPGTAKRHLGTMSVKVFRDSDPMRTGIIADFEEISAGSICLRLPLPVNVFEQVKVHFENEVQGFEQELRGTVRSSVTDESVFTRLEIELFNRLSSFDLSALENAGLYDKPVKGPVWM